MKKALLVSLFSVPCLLAAQSVIYTDDFESYTVGDYIAQSNGMDWSTWSADPGGTEDAPISDAFAQSGSNSVAIIATSLTAGPTDLLLKLGNKTTGSYSLTFSLYIPTGKGGYFNLQHQEDVSPIQFALEVIMPASGNINVSSSATPETIGTYPHDTWFDVTLSIDLGDTTSTLVIANNAAYTWASNTVTDGTVFVNQIGAIDFFANGGPTDFGEMYIDDVTYTDNTSVGVAEAAQLGATTYPNPTKDVVNVTLPSALSAQATVQLMDLTGSMVNASTLVNGNAIRVNMKAVPAGVYFLRVTDGNLQTVQRLVKN